MRKTAKKLIDAYNAGRSATVGNSSVSVGTSQNAVFSLHGNPIVIVKEDAKGRRVVEVSFAGWPTPTTRSRINDICWGLCQLSPVSQHRGSQRVDGFGEVSSCTGNWYRVYPPVS